MKRRNYAEYLLTIGAHCAPPTTERLNHSLDTLAAVPASSHAEHLQTEIPPPRSDESPTQYSARLAERFSNLQSADIRSQHGQFFTPIEVARFMASLARPGPGVLRALDPGAGTGVLSCALCEYALREGQEIHLDAFELDLVLAAYCKRALRHAQTWLAVRGINLSFEVHISDFVLEHSSSLAPGLFDQDPKSEYSIVISNPPYFKLSKTDPRSLAALPVIHGQPNIYAIFMAVSASLLSEGGVMVTITPRSFATGDYFSRCRQYLFSRIVPEAVHLFESRKEAFKADAVLQESVILAARRGCPQSTATVQLSTSRGVSDIRARTPRTVSLASIVDFNSPRVIFHIPADDNDEAILRFVRNWPHTLHSLGMEVSTGPVVAFRARKFLLDRPDHHNGSAPLLWLQNVRPLSIQWPLEKRSKPQYILDSSSSNYLLLPNKTYVVLRRFSAKEEERRLVAAPLLRGAVPGRRVGLENHLNYVHRPHGHISEDLAIGLAALLGSSLVDRYFRISNGNTQVNAAELRALPLPSEETLKKLGRAVGERSGMLLETDTLFDELLAVPQWLRRFAGGALNWEK